MRKGILACLIVGCCLRASGQEPVPVRSSASGQPSVATATLASPADRIAHLAEAAEHLQAAGLEEKARELRELVQREREALLHRIETLQAEVERLRQLVGESQVLVHVKMVEISRGRLRELGLEFHKAATGIVEDGDAVFDVLEALRQDELARVLAEPTLVTLSGRPASIRVGGEIPRLMPQGDGTVAIEYKPYGTQIDLVPIVFGKGRIRLELRARVAKLDFTRSVEVQGQTCPAINVREIDTGVEIQTGQTLILGGPVHRSTTRPVSHLAEATDGSQAGDTSEQAAAGGGQTELLILVRPEIVDAPGLCLSAKRRSKPAPNHVPRVPAAQALRAVTPESTR